MLTLKDNKEGRKIARVKGGENATFLEDAWRN